MATCGVETRPRTFKPSLKGFLSLPFRLCNPPPAVGKVRSCSVTPLIKIRLEDILNRKHLPPLGLKDFEEWLLYVEMSPENLYFVLWLEEYTVKYREWATNSKLEREINMPYRIPGIPPSSAPLAMFYARAKQTFFMPNSPYELDVPSDILAPFHAPDFSPHPDPALFNEISREVRRLLDRSLDRFVQAQLNNVGTNRVLCGIVAGTFFCLSGSIAPLVLNFTRGHSRWNRLAAFPGLWFGLTVLLAALNGICLSVYFLGDLRQLHRFELSRPSISKPQHIRARRQRPSISLPLTAPPPPPLPPPLMVSPVLQSSQVLPVRPPPAHVEDNRLSRTSTRASQMSEDSQSSSTQSSYSAPEEIRIEISAAYYDADPVDGPATSPITPESYFFNIPPKAVDESEKGIFTTTAAFIHQYDSTSILGSDSSTPRLSADQRQPISAFDFDALPSRSPYFCKPTFTSPDEHGIIEITTHVPPLSKISPRTIAERIQLRCNPKKWFVVDRDTTSVLPTTSRRSTDGVSVSVRHEKVEQVAQKRFRVIRAVPAFTSLTRILSPVIIRGQWEIVVRSMLISFLLTWVVLGSLLAVPVIR